MSTMLRPVPGLVLLFVFCVVVRASAGMNDQEFDRFLKRYTGHWKANIAKSRYIVGDAPAEGASHTYSPVPGKRAIKFNNDTVHLLDGRDHPIASNRPGATVARVVLDEFTVANTLKQNGKVTSRNTFVLSPDGKSAVMVFMNIDDRGEPTVRSVVYYDKVQ